MNKSKQELQMVNQRLMSLENSINSMISLLRPTKERETHIVQPEMYAESFDYCEMGFDLNEIRKRLPASLQPHSGKRCKYRVDAKKYPEIAKRVGIETWLTGIFIDVAYSDFYGVTFHVHWKGRGDFFVKEIADIDTPMIDYKKSQRLILYYQIKDIELKVKY